MIFRVPLLLQRSVAVVHRLDVTATRTLDPPGEDTSGYDEDLREPIAYTSGAARVESRQELPAVRIPCQVEIASDRRLRELGLGDAAISNMIFVFHRRDLENLSLLDADRSVIIKKGDRISKLERHGAPPGTTIKKFGDDGLFIVEMKSASWGFGPDGYDLELGIVTERREGVTT